MKYEKMIATREGFGEEIVALGQENQNILVVDADIGKSCKTGAFRKALPEQYLNVGIAEQNCAGVAAGLATCGKIPFVVTYAAFGSMRMLEMIRQERRAAYDPEHDGHHARGRCRCAQARARRCRIRRPRVLALYPRQGPRPLWRGRKV